MKNKKKNNQDSLIENPELLAGSLSSFEKFVKKNKFIVSIVLLVLFLSTFSYFGFDYYKKYQDEKGQIELFQAVFYFESDSLELALNGDGINLGFIDIIDNYSYSDAANLSNFYAGACYFKQEDYKSAILYLEDFSSSDLLLQPRVYMMIADANMELEDYEKAAMYYEKAANLNSNKYFSPRYLMKAALAHTLNENYKSASDNYDKIITEFWDSDLIQEAKKNKAKLGDEFG